MQVTINKVPFDVRPVDAATRAALFAEPALAGSLRRAVWAWDREAGTGCSLVPVKDDVVPLPSGLLAYVAKPAATGARREKADGPTQRMAERLLAAVGAKTLGQVMQALGRVTGQPAARLPLAAFAPLNPQGSYTLRMDVGASALELSNAGRNLQAFVVLPGLVGFWAAMADGAPNGAAAGLRPGFVVAPPTQAALTMRRMAVAQRLNELQATLGGAKVTDLPAEDPRRVIAAQLGAEWRVLQPKAKAA